MNFLSIAKYYVKYSVPAVLLLSCPSVHAAWTGKGVPHQQTVEVAGFEANNLRFVLSEILGMTIDKEIVTSESGFGKILLKEFTFTPPQFPENFNEIKWVRLDHSSCLGVYIFEETQAAVDSAALSGNIPVYFDITDTNGNNVPCGAVIGFYKPGAKTPASTPSSQDDVPEESASE